MPDAPAGPPDSRRVFIGTVAGGLAGALAAPRLIDPGRSVRVGLIGAGDRGLQLAREAVQSGAAEITAVADVYPRRLDDACALAPKARRHSDFRAVLDDAAVDAVLIATPPHLHCRHFLAALAAGKHIYIEKVMAFSLDEAKLMRSALAQAPAPPVVTVGHQACSSAMAADARRFCDSGALGRVTMIQADMFRNTPHGKPQWARPVYPDVTPGTIDWDAFLGDAPAREFDANRFVNWRLFWDYSGGNFFENMSHQLAFWYKTLGLSIPRAVTATGGLYLWKDGREVPDTMSVSMEHTEEILFTWDSSFGNNQPGVAESVLGTDGTLARGQRLRLIPQKVNRPEGIETTGRGTETPGAHMRDFLNAVHSGNQPACPFELGFRVSLACRMAVDSFRLQRTVRWDPVTETIV